AAAALAFAANPRATPSQVRAAIVASARPLAALKGGTVAGGMIDAAALVRRVASLPAVTPTPTPTPAPAAPAPAPTPAPVSTPAPVVSPHLSLSKPRRRGGMLLVSGRVARAFHGTVTVRA